MLTSLCLVLALVAPKVPTHVEVLSGGPAPSEQLMLVVYTDTSMAVGPLSSFSPRGEVLAGAAITMIEPPTSDKLVTRWTDVRGLTREVITDCGSMKAVDCAIQHNKMVDTMLLAAPVKRDEK